MNAQLHCKILILLRSLANNAIFTLQLFTPRQITSTAGLITSHNCGSQVTTLGTSVLWQSHSRHSPCSWLFLQDNAAMMPGTVCPSMSLVLPAAFQGLATCLLPSKPGRWIFPYPAYPGPRLSSYNENTNQWLTEMAITKRLLATLLFI